MAQYKQFAPNVEVNGESVLATVDAFPDFIKRIALQILAKNGIMNPMPGKWYNQQALLDSLKEIDGRYGSNTLFEIGKAIPSNAIFPSEINTIEMALDSINIAYHMNHRFGEIGFYKIVFHDKTSKIFTMHCNNPYPCDFDRGIITSMASKFSPQVEVMLDITKPSRKKGADDSYYIVTYN